LFGGALPGFLRLNWILCCCEVAPLDTLDIAARTNDFSDLKVGLLKYVVRVEDCGVSCIIKMGLFHFRDCHFQNSGNSLRIQNSAHFIRTAVNVALTRVGALPRSTAQSFCDLAPCAAPHCSMSNGPEPCAGALQPPACRLHDSDLAR
jgi:hypothetical protein